MLVDQALNFVNEHLLPSSPAPRVVPLSSGGLQLEWHSKGIDLEIMFEPGRARKKRMTLRMFQNDPDIADRERLLRRIPPAWMHWDEFGNPSISSAAFKAISP